MNLSALSLSSSARAIGFGLVCALTGAAACGGDAFHDAADAFSPSDLSKIAAPPDPNPNSRQAVQDTLARNAACKGIKPFYWEIGYAGGSIVGDSVGLGYGRDSSMEIASSSKWLYAAYYLQKKNGVINDEKDIALLNFTSGYASIADSACLLKSVSQCNQSTHNETQGTPDHPGNDTSAAGRFFYNSGHLEKHAEQYGSLGSKTASTLGAALLTQLGDKLSLSYDNPILAGGGHTTAASYALFLQRILSGSLRMNAALGTHAVCTLSAEYATLFGETCDAVGSPWWPATSGKLADTPDPSLVKDVHYSLGHWVEADGAFSSPGLFGFYPWIDSGKTWYGIIARRQKLNVYDPADPQSSAYVQSVLCGQAVRSAWLTGTAQP